MPRAHVVQCHAPLLCERHRLARHTKIVQCHATAVTRSRTSQTLRLRALVRGKRVLRIRHPPQALPRAAAPHQGASWKPAVAVRSRPNCASCWIAPSFSAIQLKHHPAHRGDLVACFDYSNLPGHQGGGPVERSGTLISSDHGQSWFVGATAVLGDECAVAELANGTVVLNARNYVNQSGQAVHRSVAWSVDGARSFTPVYFPWTLPDPVVEGSMIFGSATSASLVGFVPRTFCPTTLSQSTLSTLST